MSDVGLVAIGRNEGERLIPCLVSGQQVAARVYVDSGSSDDSVGEAARHGWDVVTLTTPPKMSAARGRNAGFQFLTEHKGNVAYVQMIDGDCEMDAGWIERARAMMATDPRLGAVFGRRRERFLDASIYNALCDDEWNIPIGEALGFGGDVLIRCEALRQAKGYDPAMIAAEDSDLAARMRKLGWHVRRIDADMTIHDAAITHFGQWWRRSQRAGHGFAELAHRHPSPHQPDWRRRCRSIVVWAAVLPAMIVAALIGAIMVPALFLLACALALLWPAKMLQIAYSRRSALPARIALAFGVLNMISKFAELTGLVKFHLRRLRGRESELIEYKLAGDPK